MMVLKVFPFDPARHLESEEDILYYLERAALNLNQNARSKLLLSHRYKLKRSSPQVKPVPTFQHDALEAAMEGNDPKHIASAFGDVARSKGMTEIACKSGIGRQALYNALSETGNPTLETLTSVLGALGLELTVHKKVA